MTDRGGSHGAHDDDDNIVGYSSRLMVALSSSSSQAQVNETMVPTIDIRNRVSGKQFILVTSAGGTIPSTVTATSNPTPLASSSTSSEIGGILNLYSNIASGLDMTAKYLNININLRSTKDRSAIQPQQPQTSGAGAGAVTYNASEKMCLEMQSLLK